MIAEIFEGVFDIVVEFIPDFVWGLLFVVAGVASTVIGVTIVGESMLVGGVLLTVGVFLLASVLYVWYR
ncbi:hypothetical protein [Salinirubrum litoreum]|uniref:Uncharacterized protein n=1 Tax=Salinirubrum litoreum TaxID=1126234 RepID=A0ABD5RCT3_9EURY|nr:hypothetical protein [Salinirubrum litoreum]